MRLVTSRAVAQVRPFKAVRYDEQRAGPLASLVAPPYDVLDAARERYLAASPHNVVHLTLSDSEVEAARSGRRGWRRASSCARKRPRAGGSPRSTSDPTALHGCARGSCALCAPSRTRPAVLPHERTHAGPKEGRLRLLRALRAQVEPIFLLYDGRLVRPDGENVLEVELEACAAGSGVSSAIHRGPRRRAAAHCRRPPSLRDDACLSRRGRSEESAWMLVVIVPTEQEGLTIFPTHRIAVRLEPVDGERPFDGALPPDRSAAVIYRARVAQPS